MSQSQSNDQYDDQSKDSNDQFKDWLSIFKENARAIILYGKGDYKHKCVSLLRNAIMCKTFLGCNTIEDMVKSLQEGEKILKLVSKDINEEEISEDEEDEEEEDEVEDLLKQQKRIEKMLKFVSEDTNEEEKNKN